jgi:hypothetical protein
MQNFKTLRQSLLGELAMSPEERGKREKKMPFIVATYVYASSQGQRTHSARTNSAIAALMAQQQAMMTNQMKMFMEFQQQQELARQQQQTQVQALLEKFHSSSSTHSLSQQPRSSPSSAEKRAERSAQEKLKK